MFKKLELLRPFDQKQAEAGDPIMWSHLSEPVTFVGMCNGGKVAVKCADGLIETPCSSSLRMKPLFWKEGKPVYRGDSLWHTLTKEFIAVTKLQGHPDSEKEGYFVDNYGLNAQAALCTFDAQPVPLFQLDGKDVFAGDKLWNTLYRDWLTVASLQEGVFPLEGYFVATDGRLGCSRFCRWEESPQSLFILDGQPVFKGTRLWHNRDNKWVTVTGVNLFGDFIDENGIGRSPSYCRWDKPTKKVVRYANVYGNNNTPKSIYFGGIFESPEVAKAKASSSAISIARIEWEE